VRADGHMKWWVVFLAALLVGSTLYIAIPSLQHKELAVAWIAGWWTFTHFQHQHSLEKTKFFFELFNRFNERYSKMNEGLQSIPEGEGMPSKEDRERVVDYFNLCAEEFMFYRRGYIPEDVWTAWRNGMNWYAKNPKFTMVWREEKVTESFYGFQFI
jgi:hypothetical protein